MDNNLFGIDISKKAIDDVEHEILTPNYKKRVNKKDNVQIQVVSEVDFESTKSSIPVSKFMHKTDRVDDIDVPYKDSSDINKEL